MNRPAGENKEIKGLLRRYVAGKCTEEEKVWIESWYVRNDHGLSPPLSAGEVEQDLRRILERMPPKKPLRSVLVRFSIAAVFVLIATAAGCYIYLLEFSPKRQSAVDTALIGDVRPGGNRAILTLADGRTVTLDTASTGIIAHQSDVHITKTSEGLLAYASALKNSTVTAQTHNTLRTPKGGQYRLMLSDGTAVWLNAASSLRYPTNFGGAARRVELRGEAYFEVAKTGAPFLVETRDQVVEVLGTHFNINAYEDEPAVKTTLLEGSVRVSAAAGAGLSGLSENTPGSPQVVLDKPGQQSVLAGRGLTLGQADPAVAIAWKEGMFRFERTGIREVMRQLSRWYNVEVVFRGEAPDIQLWGEVYRNVNASQALDILAYFDLKYEILQNGTERKIVIYRR